MMFVGSAMIGFGQGYQPVCSYCFGARLYDRVKKACVYCVKKEKPGAMVYITNYGTNYHNRKTCRGLKRTVMAIPYSQTGGMRCCQGCGGS